MEELRTMDFDNRINNIVKIYENAINHFASRTWEMFDRYGKIEALSRLVVSPDLQTGFKVLRDKGMLNDTFEHAIIEFKDKFTKEVIQAAQWRLDHPYDLL